MLELQYDYDKTVDDIINKGKAKIAPNGRVYLENDKAANEILTRWYEQWPEIKIEMPSIEKRVYRRQVEGKGLTSAQRKYKELPKQLKQEFAPDILKQIEDN